MSSLDWTKVGWAGFIASIKGIATAEQGEVNLEKLYKWLNDLDGRAPKDLQLKRLAYDWSSNDYLGLSGQKDDFTTFMPWGSWDRENNRDYPAPLQQAMINVLNKGKEFSQTTPFPYVDLASLKPQEGFLTVAGGSGSKSVRDTIVDFIGSCDKKSYPVVRFLIGDDTAQSRNQAWSGANRDLLTRLFWDHGKPRVDHPNAKIYVRYYNPDFNPK